MPIQTMPIQIVPRARSSMPEPWSMSLHTCRRVLHLTAFSNLLCCRIHIIGVYVVKSGATMTKRLNITLPERTVALMDRVVGKGQRSRFIDQAVHRYVEEAGRANLRKQLREGAHVRAERDLQLAEEWFTLDE